MLVVGVDPGTFKMGVGAVRSDSGDLILAHTELLSPKQSATLEQRLAWLHSKLAELLETLRPEVVAIEQPFVSRNVRAAMAVGQAQAVAMIAAADLSIPVASYAAREVKKAVTDYGGSSKEQVQEMVRVLLDLPDAIESSDRADALAIAICHINNSQVYDVTMRE
ncbi:MAG: crossover junction endodeoxyribonuclease RuvC [SAR202 cluster bacterium]|jgi:crossover junction endodeoxyribonuclease RuvC|nr:crossover junction endodeoxyribonuclease RuvC [SAR202 cluster bacterium]MDP6299925.1 crossover junction endodeoxyribonuclease RuvC [SAR202 cluster bacterium]MDP7102177.1 crossover junction endodeoxyribonuclease RuvC [SAR202 cluster bacterium]MDP7224032.1 crossover junction endodeoxyribonuclease RuvC [SAR202 cluster bacterium]MDP7412399.1 crossover junction endodeoxyribonuclease RuvC [SAR202 cluster bacterium]|tara:strand:+ start:1632 stop:2126 length:495 start_codon:yes stop_codon:yes gene_type:complete